MHVTLKSKLAQDFLSLAPKVVSKPLKIVPFALKSKLLTQFLGYLLKEQIEDDELDFLENRWVGINIIDINLTFEVSYANGFIVRPLVAPEVTFSANSAELLLVAAGKEDPDTLFFQRKLSIEGDTELGLEVKNLLLSIDLSTVMDKANIALNKIAGLLVKIQQQAAKSSSQIALN